MELSLIFVVLILVELVQCINGLFHKITKWLKYLSLIELMMSCRLNEQQLNVLAFSNGSYCHQSTVRMSVSHHETIEMEHQNQQIYANLPIHLMLEIVLHSRHTPTQIFQHLH